MARASVSGGTVHDPNDPVGRLLFNVLGMVAEFEADLIRQRTHEGLRIAAANGRLKGRPPKLSTAQEDLLRKLHSEGQHTIVQLAELFGVGRATVYRALGRTRTTVGGDNKTGALSQFRLMRGLHPAQSRRRRCGHR